MIFDIDNTLVPAAHGAPADARAEALFSHLESIGYSCCLLFKQPAATRGAVQQKYRREFYLEDAHKPSVKSYQKAMKMMGTDTENTLFVGDQLFTDVFEEARRTGIHSILVKPIHPKEEIQIVLKRYLEKIVLHFYLKEQHRKR